MREERFRVGDRVDYNNSHRPETLKPNGTPGRIRRVIIARKYVIDWDDAAFSESFDDTEPYEAHELIRLEVKSD